LTVLTSAAFAERVLVDCENYTDSNDILYEVIQTLVAPSCHGGFVLVGLDYSNEWVEYELTVSAFGTWAVGAVGRGDAGVPYVLHLSVTGNVTGAYQTTMISYTGAGYG
jgi:hypothetical protein